MVVLPRGCPFPPEGTGDVFKFTEHRARPASQRSEASLSSPGRRTKDTLRRSGIAGSSWDTSNQGGNHLATTWEWTGNTLVSLPAREGFQSASTPNTSVTRMRLSKAFHDHFLRRSAPV